MDYEKAYKEALERAKAGKPLDEVFSELKESEDERIRKSLVEYFRKFTPEKMWDEMFSFGDVVSYLEKKKEQQPAEWNEEDEKMLDAIIHDVMTLHNAKNLEELKNKVNWLKSLRPQPHWKPSEEQMEYLAKGIIILGEDGNCKTSAVLNELRNDLQKLL